MPLPTNSIIGHDWAVSLLLRSVERGNASHAYLIRALTILANLLWLVFWRKCSTALNSQGDVASAELAN